MNRAELRKLTVLFFTGFVIYITIEVVWTSVQNIYEIGSGPMALMGGSSLWMGVLGGILFLLLGQINEFAVVRDRFPLAIQSLIGALLITVLEFITGMILNVWLKLDIWDYTGFPLANLFYNQINLVHSLCWFLLCPFAFWMDDVLRWVFYRVGNCKKSNGIYNFFWYYVHLFKLTPPKLEVLS